MFTNINIINVELLSNIDLLFNDVAFDNIFLLCYNYTDFKKFIINHNNDIKIFIYI